MKSVSLREPSPNNGACDVPRRHQSRAGRGLLPEGWFLGKLAFVHQASDENMCSEGSWPDRRAGSTAIKPSQGWHDEKMSLLTRLGARLAGVSLRSLLLLWVLLVVGSIFHREHHRD